MNTLQQIACVFPSYAGYEGAEEALGPMVYHVLKIHIAALARAFRLVSSPREFLCPQPWFSP